MENSRPGYNLLHNLSPKQKIAIILGALLIIMMIVLSINMSRSGDGADSESEKATNETTQTESVTDELGYTTTTEVYTDDDNQEHVVSMREDPYGNVTTTDPELITTYFPYQVMREHKEWTPTLRYYLSIDEDAKTINVTMEDCDVGNDQKLINDYINSIPIDLSAYTIEHELISADIDCSP